MVLILQNAQDTLWLVYSFQFLCECAISSFLCFYVVRMVLRVNEWRLSKLWLVCASATLFAILQFTLNAVQTRAHAPIGGWPFDLSYLAQSYYLFHVLVPMKRKWVNNNASGTEKPPIATLSLVSTNPIQPASDAI